METIFQTAVLPLLLACGAGAMLWIAGGRLLRPALALAAVAIALLAGWFIWDRYAGGFSPWLIMGLAALIGGCLGAMLYRLILAATLAIGLAGAIPFCVLILSGVEPTVPVVAPSPAPMIAPHGGGVAQFADDLAVTSQTAAHASFAFFEQLDAPTQSTAALAAIAGLLVGLLLSLFIPTASAVIATSLGGAALLLWSVMALADSTGGTWGAVLPTTWHDIVVAWLIAAAVGIALQMIILGPSTSSASPTPSTA